MGNCLKTQLSAVVNNDNLPIFGKLVLEVGPYSQGESASNISAEENYERRITLMASTDGKIGEVVSADGTKLQDLIVVSGQCSYVYPSNATEKVRLLFDKYKYTGLENRSVQGKLNYLVKYNLDELLQYTENLTWFIVGGDSIDGNLSDMVSKLDKEKITTFGFTYTNIWGDYSALGMLTKLQTFVIKDNSKMLPSTLELETLVEAQIAAGRDYVNYPTLRLVESLFYVGLTLYNSAIVNFGANNTATIVVNSSTIATYNGSTWTYNS